MKVKNKVLPEARGPKTRLRRLGAQRQIDGVGSKEWQRSPPTMGPGRQVFEHKISKYF